MLEAISHLRAFSRDSDALREDNRALRAERDALREALTWALDRLNNARNVCYGGVTLEEIEERRAALSGKGKA